MVSGFNVEYGGGGFLILFLFEYSNVIFLSVFSVAIFLGGGWLFGLSMDLGLVFKSLVMIGLIIILRGCFPRLRYDKLMMIA